MWNRLLLAVLLLGGAAPLAGQGPAAVVVVRHAEKASATERDPVLSEAGQARAGALAAVLADSDPAAVIVTQYQRTRLTAADVTYAGALVPIEVRTQPDLAAHAREVAARVAEQPAGSTVLVVGHSDSVHEIILALGGPDVGELCDETYDALFVVLRHPERGVTLLRSRYGAQSPAPTCGRMLRDDEEGP